jgi:hypothetical protein
MYFICGHSGRLSVSWIDLLVLSGHCRYVVARSCNMPFECGYGAIWYKVKCTLVQALRLCTGHMAHRGSRGIALPFLDHSTRRGWGSASRPGHFLPPGKTRYPLYRRPGGPQGRSGQVRKISPSPGFDPQTAQPVVSCYTDWATQHMVYYLNKILRSYSCLFKCGFQAMPSAIERRQQGLYNWK